jgi:hypothetical protein
MAEIKSGVTLSLKDLFSQGMGKAAGAASGFAGKTLGAVDKVDKALSGTATKLAAFGLTLSVGAAAKGIIEMDHRMTRLGLSANASAEQISKMKRAIFDAAQAPDVKIDSSSVLSGIEVIINKTNDLKYAEDNIRNLALAIQATGESGESMGDLFSEFRKFEYSAEQISSLIDDMAAQANEGAFSLGEFAKAAPQVFSTLEAKKIGATPENIKKVNTALQIINAGAKNPTKTVAAFNSMLEELGDPEKRKNLKRIGVDVIDPVTKEFRDFNDIMLDIAEKSKNSRNADYLNRIFNSSSMQAVNSYVSHGERMIGNLTDLGDTTGQLQKQSAAMANTLQSNIKNLQTAFNSFADSNLTKPLSDLTGLLNKLAEDPERIKKVFTGIAVGIGAITAVKGVAGISRLVSSLSQLKGGKINIAESLNMSSAMPVYVTNWSGGTGVSEMAQSAGSSGIGGGVGIVSLIAAGAAAYAVAKKAQPELAKLDPAVPGVSNYYNLNPKARKKLWEEYTAKTGKTQEDFLPEIPFDNTNLPGWMQTPKWMEALSERRQPSVIPAANLPPQITQTGSSVMPQKIELGGQAVMDVNVNPSGVSPAAAVTMRDNTTDFRFNTGSRTVQRRNGI